MHLNPGQGTHISKVLWSGVRVILGLRTPGMEDASPHTSTKQKVSGWWFEPTPLKNMKVNWGDCSQYMENMFHSINQI